MKTENTIKLNKAIGKALVEVAHEAYEKRIERMKSRPFDEVIKSIKTYRKTRYNKANGYFADDALRYFDERLEKEYEEIWLEIEDVADADWFDAIERFRW